MIRAKSQPKGWAWMGGRRVIKPNNHDKFGILTPPNHTQTQTHTQTNTAITSTDRENLVVEHTWLEAGAQWSLEQQLRGQCDLCV